MERRDFLKSATAAGIASTLPIAQAKSSAPAKRPESPNMIYRELGTTVQPIEALHYGLTQPVSVIITGIDNTQVLDQVFEAARTFKPFDQVQINSLLARIATAASEGKFELFKTTNHFDGTAANPKWLG